MAPEDRRQRISLLIAPETLERWKATGEGWRKRMGALVDASPPTTPPETQ